jgi:hypothetical protein
MMLKMRIGAYKDQYPQMCLGILIQAYECEPLMWRWRPGISHDGAVFALPKYDTDIEFRIEALNMMLKDFEKKHGPILPASAKAEMVRGINRLRGFIQEAGGMIFTPEYAEPSFA